MYHQNSGGNVKEKEKRVSWKPTTPDKKSNIDAKIRTVLIEAWQRGFTTKSDFARENADYVAIAACMGFTTTRIFPPDVWGSTWNITSKGLLALEAIYGVKTEEDPEEEEAYLR